MSNSERPAEVLAASVVEALYMRFRGLDGFQGADLGLRSPSRETGDSDPVLRLHLAPGSLGMPELPDHFGGIPLQLRQVRHGSDMASPPLPTVPHLTGGAPCVGQGPHAGPAGQVGLMVAERGSARVGFLTSLAGAFGVAGQPGTFVHEAAPTGVRGEPLGQVTAKCCGRAGLAAFCMLEPGRPWLPIERPGNIAITSLSRPAIGDRLSAAGIGALVDGVGFYRIRTAAGTEIDMHGFRTAQTARLPSGALVYDQQLWSGVGLVTASATEAGDARYAISSEIVRVMAAMNLRLAGYDDLLFPPVPAVSAPAAAKVRRVDAMLGDPRDVVASGTASEDLEPNARPDIATAIWPPLRLALSKRSPGHGPGAAARRIGITDRIERLDSAGRARSKIAAAINGSATFAAIGLRHVDAADFRHCVTIDQVCERIADILAAYAEQNHP